MTTKSIGIIGCGWLGKVLAKALLDDNYQVITSVRSEEKQQQLITEGIPTVCLTLPVQPNDNTEVFAVDTLVVLVTPQLRYGKQDYAENIQSLVAAAEQQKVSQIILVSSTAVYDGLYGEVDEDSKLALTSDKAKIIYQAEQAVLNFNGIGQVLRLSGLLGDDRHPGRFLAGKTDLTGGNDPVNLIHQQDAMGLLLALIKQTSPQANKVYVGVSRTNVNKAEFYQAAAKKLSLPAPEFIKISALENNLTNKKIVGEKTRQALNYQYCFDDLLGY